MDLITMGPVVAAVLEGIDAIEAVRKMCGDTEPSKAAPGTIRGDLSHVNFTVADNADKALRNIVHASGNKEEAEQEIMLWFSDNELHSYKTVHDKHILHE